MTSQNNDRWAGDASIGRCQLSRGIFVGTRDALVRGNRCDGADTARLWKPIEGLEAWAAFSLGKAPTAMINTCGG